MTDAWAEWFAGLAQELRGQSQPREQVRLEGEILGPSATEHPRAIEPEGWAVPYWVEDDDE